MERHFETVDVFTDRAFGGNPLAVVLDAEGLDTAAMQAIAREFNLSETSFVLPPGRAENHARIRIFTPRSELPFAGHPTIGTGFVLARRAASAGSLPDEFRFEMGAGTVPVRPVLRDGIVTGTELRAPVPLDRRSGIAAERVAAALGLPAATLRLDRHPPEIVSVGLPVLAVELDNPGSLARCATDLPGMIRLLGDEAAIGLYPYVRLGPSRLRARLFAPADGIPEDPATGSAAAALAALQAALSPPGETPVVLQIEQGIEMGRPSLIHAAVSAESGVRIAGDCVPVMRGHLVVPDRR